MTKWAGAGVLGGVPRLASELTLSVPPLIVVMPLYELLLPKMTVEPE
jgi:hypothetical protein